MSRLILGLLAGALASALRAPLGLDLLQLPAAEAETVYGLRALALSAIAIALVLAPRVVRGDRPNGDLLVASALGFLGHGLLVSSLAESGGPSALRRVGLVVAVVAGAAVLSRFSRHAETEKKAFVPAAGMLGLVLCGAGATLALEGVARHVRLLGGGLPLDDAVFGGTFLLCATFGGISFGRFLRSLAGDRAQGRSAAASLVLAAALCFAALYLIEGLNSIRGLDRFLRRFDMDTSLHGTWSYDALIGATVLVLPAFAVGTALYAARRRSELAPLFLGAALGLVGVPILLSIEPGASFEEARSSADLVPIGAWIAVIGAVVSALPGPGRWSGCGRLTSALCGAACAAAALAFPVHPLPVLSPWAIRPVFPTLVVDTADGFLTVEPSGADFRMVTLDRRPLTPPIEATTADGLQLKLSFDLLDASARTTGVRVLFVGQLTPIRAQSLFVLGATLVDRTGAWHDVMGGIEEHLFVSPETPRPAGEILSPGAARRALAAGNYDLVVAPPVAGGAPLVPRLDPPEGTVVVAWLDASSGLAWRSTGGPLLLGSDGFDHLAAAVVAGADREPAPIPGEPALVPAGAPLAPPTAWSWLGMRQRRRAELALAAFGERLAAANSETDWAELTQGLFHHYAAQRHSSPFETDEQRVELDDLSLQDLHLAALSREPDAFTRELWNGLARVLVGKRSIEQIYFYLEPLAGAWPPWNELVRALAEADIEALDAETALARLDPLVQENPGDVDAVWLLARAREAAGDREGTIVALRWILTLEPADRRARRQLAAALVAQGDPEGKEIVRQLLQQDPEDEYLRALLEGADEGAVLPLPSGRHDH